MMAELAAVIAAVFTGVSGVILALTRWQAQQIKDLITRVGHLESEQEEQRGLFREAVLFIRALLSQMRSEGIDAPDVPDKLKGEV